MVEDAGGAMAQVSIVALAGWCFRSSTMTETVEDGRHGCC